MTDTVTLTQMYAKLRDGDRAYYLNAYRELHAQTIAVIVTIEDDHWRDVMTNELIDIGHQIAILRELIAKFKELDTVDPMQPLAAPWGEPNV